MARFNFYTVAKGKYPHSPGIYRTWAEADYHVTGVSDARYCGHKTRKQAEQWLAQNLEDCDGASTSSLAPETPGRAPDMHWDMAARSPSGGFGSSSPTPTPALLPVSAPGSSDDTCRSWFICTNPAVDRDFMDTDFYGRVPIIPLGDIDGSGQHTRRSTFSDGEDEFQYYHVPAPFSESKKFYAVARGYTPGVYTSYHGPQGAFKQVHSYSENVYKRFESEQAAWDYILEYRRQRHQQRRTARTKRQRMLQGGISDAWEGIREERLDAAARRLAAQMSPSSSRAPSPVPLDVVVHVAGACAVDSGRAGIGLFFDVDDWHNSSEPCPAEWESQERADIFAVVRALQIAPRGSGILSIRTVSINSIANLAYCSGRERAYINKQLARRRRREQTVRILPSDAPCTPALELARFGTKMKMRENGYWVNKLSRLALPVVDDDAADDELDAVLRASFSEAASGGDLAAAPVRDEAPADTSDASVAGAAHAGARDGADDEGTRSRRSDDRNFHTCAEDLDMPAESDSADVAMLDDCALLAVPVQGPRDECRPARVCARGNATEGEPAAIMMDGPHLTLPLPRVTVAQDNVSDDEFPDDDSSWMDAAPADWLSECERRPRCSTPPVAVAEALPSLGAVEDMGPAGQDEYDDWMDALPVGLLWECAAAVAEPTARDAPPRPTPHSGMCGAGPIPEDDLDSASAWIDGIPESQLASFDRDSLDDADDSVWIDTLSVEELDLLDGGQA
ncbi:hypothetical protein AURDEDRAFT_151568 [Auricularia subglabra TFB-10046 SS5]|nr:hypothetical protein AURDEDRAFT_151568 [Auricularia subglabra TFB-10046 SS5]